MGSYSRESCYPDAVQAAQAACAAYPVVSPTASGVVTTSCTGVAVDGSSLTLSVATAGASSPVASTVAVSFPDCDPSATYNQLGSLFLVFLAAGMGVVAMRSFVLRLVAEH